MDISKPSLSYKLFIIFIYIIIFWVIFPGFLLLTGLRLDYILNSSFVATLTIEYISYFLISAGSLLMIVSTLQLFYKGKGLPISHLPPVNFVSTGVYRIFRHPIYIGYTITFAGVALWSCSVWSLVYSTPFLVLCWIGYTLYYEEPALERKFGKEYSIYKKKTPLLFYPLWFSAISRLLSFSFNRFNGILSAIANRTILFRKGNLIFVTYGLIISIGSFVFMLILSSLFILKRIEQSKIIIFLFGSGLSAIIFARLFWWLGNWKQLIKEKFYGLNKIGFVSYGGLFGLLFFSFVFAIIFEFPFLLISDSVLRGMFIVYSLGRIGCLTFGCCYGIISSKDGVIFKNSDSKVIREKGFNQSTRYPTQIYSFFEGFILFLILNLICYQSIPVGFTTVIAFLLYPIGRSFIEFYRDRKRYLNGIFTDGHIGCIIMYLFGWIILFFLSPNINEFSPQPIDYGAMIESFSMLPTFLIVSIIIFIVAGFHWKKVGSW